MNKYIILGIIIIAFGGGIGTYFIHLGRTKLTEKNTKEITRKVSRESKKSKKRDKNTQDIIKESRDSILSEIRLTAAEKEDLKQHYLSLLGEKDEKLRLAEEKISELLETQESLSSDDETLKEAFTLFNNKDIDNAISLIQENLINKSEKTLQEYYLITSNMYFSKLDIENGTKYLDLYISERPSIEKYLEAAKVLRRLNLLQKTDNYLNKAIQIIEANNIDDYDKEYLAGIYSFSGTVKIQIRQPLNGVEHLIMAQSLYNKLQGFEKEKAGISINMGNLHYSFGDVDLALKQFHKAKKELEIIEDSTNIYDVSQLASLYQNLSNIYREQKENYDLASEYNEKSINVIRKVDDFLENKLFWGILINYSYTNAPPSKNRGSFVLANSEFSLAAESCIRFSKYEPLALDYLLAKIYKVHGQLKLEEKLVDDGVELLTKALDIYKSLNSIERQRYMSDIIAIERDLEINKR